MEQTAEEGKCLCFESVESSLVKILVNPTKVKRWCFVCLQLGCKNPISCDFFHFCKVFFAETQALKSMQSEAQDEAQDDTG